MAFILTKFSAEVRSYAVAVIALLLMVIVPLYGLLRRRVDGTKLLHFISVLFAGITGVFAFAAYTGANIAFAFFIWGSIYGVMVTAQFWALAADTFNQKSGQRLFPVIMVGANVGALVGAKTAQLAVAALTPSDSCWRRRCCCLRRFCWWVPSAATFLRDHGQSQSSTASPCRNCSVASGSCCAIATCC